MINRPQNHKRPWQTSEDGEIIAKLGSELLRTIARRLGRTEKAVYSRIHRAGLAHGIRPRTQAGMSEDQVAWALGVHGDTVRNWARYGWLRQHRGYGVKMSYATYDAHDVSSFLMERGGVMVCIKPTDPIWREEVAAARTAILARCIAKPELEKLLCVSPQALTRRIACMGFPAPVIAVANQTPRYFDRAAVRKWLDERPRYWTSKARAEI